MRAQRSPVIQEGHFRGLLSRTVATVPIVYRTRAGARVQEKAETQWRLSRQSATVAGLQQPLRCPLRIHPDHAFAPPRTVFLLSPNAPHDGSAAR